MKCLNNITPNQLTVLANAIAIGIAENRSASENNILAGFISAIGSNLSLIAAQQDSLDTIAEKKEQIEDLKQQIKDLEKDLCQ